MQKKPTPKIAAIIQARMGSTRLPGKVLLDLHGKPVIERVIERVLRSQKIHNVIIATTDKQEDDIIAEFVKQYHNPRITVFRGSELDVRDRYLKAAQQYGVDIIVRVTSDCPVIDPKIIDTVVSEFLASDADYAANILEPRTYPRGLDVEVFSFDILQKIHKTVDDAHDREHVTLYIRKNPHLFTTKSIMHDQDYSNFRWTLDEPDDYKFLQAMYQNLYPMNPNFDMEEVIAFLDKHPEIIKINEHVQQKHT